MNKQYDEMRKWTSVLYRQYQIYMNNNMKDLDINSSECCFLTTMYNNGNISQDELCKKLLIDRAAIARTIKSLEEKNYISRSKDNRDKRINRIKLTNKGIEIKERLLYLNNSWGDMVADNIDDETFNKVIDIIKQMSLKSIEGNKL